MKSLAVYVEEVKAIKAAYERLMKSVKENRKEERKKAEKAAKKNRK